MGLALSKLRTSIIRTFNWTNGHDFSSDMSVILSSGLHIEAGSGKGDRNYRIDRDCFDRLSSELGPSFSIVIRWPNGSIWTGFAYSGRVHRLTSIEISGSKLPESESGDWSDVSASFNFHDRPRIECDLSDSSTTDTDTVWSLWSRINETLQSLESGKVVCIDSGAVKQ